MRTTTRYPLTLTTEQRRRCNEAAQREDITLMEWLRAAELGLVSRKKQAPKEYPVEPELAEILKQQRKRLFSRREIKAFPAVFRRRRWWNQRVASEGNAL